MSRDQGVVLWQCACGHKQYVPNPGIFTVTCTACGMVIWEKRQDAEVHTVSDDLRKKIDEQLAAWNRRFAEALVRGEISLDAIPTSPKEIEFARAAKKIMATPEFLKAFRDAILSDPNRVGDGVLCRRAEKKDTP